MDRDAGDLTRAPSTEPTALYRARDELYAADMLVAALNGLDLFSWLSEHPGTNEDICEHFGLRPRPVDVMTTLFVAMGLLKRHGSRLETTELAREHLVNTSPWFLGPYYPKLGDRPIARDLLGVLRTNHPARFASRADEEDWHHAMETERFAEEFLAAMDVRGRLTAQALAKNLNLPSGVRVLDVGGGSGIYACALAARVADLRATVLEKPPVDRITRRAIAARGFDDRVDVVAADMLQEPLPQGYNVHLFSNVLHDWDEDVARGLLASSAAALPRGGTIVIHDAFLDTAKDGPLPIAAYSVLLMHVTQGRCYSIGEMDGWLTAAGFSTAAVVPTAVLRSAMVATRK